MIHAAVIPLAGQGTRMGTLCRAVPKGMLPLPGVAGAAPLPVVHFLLVEAAAAGVRQAVLVVSPWQRPIFQRYLDATGGDAAGGSWPGEVLLVEQARPRGLGDAVLQARWQVGDERFLVMLGDHVLRAAPGRERCSRQLAAAADVEAWKAFVGVQAVGESDLAKVGVCRGEPTAGGALRCVDFVEKPDVATARRRLVSPHLPRGRYLAHLGIYAFGPEIFDCLAELAGRGGEGELELAAAQSLLLERFPGEYLLLEVEGRALDVGSPQGYVEAFRTLAEA